MRTISYEQAIEIIQNTCNSYKINTTLLDRELFPQGTETDNIQDDITLRVKYKPYVGSCEMDDLPLEWFNIVRLEFTAIARYTGPLSDDELIILADRCTRLGKCICQLTEEFRDTEVNIR